MPGPDYHAWTHLPKEQGGTDPIDIPVPKWAVATYSTQTHTISGGVIRPRFHRLYTNDTSLYSLEEQSEDTIRLGTNSWADYVGVAEDGYYEVQIMIHTTSSGAFDTFNTELIPIYDNGVGDVDVAAGTFSVWDTRQSVHSNPKATAEWAHRRIWLNAGYILDSDLEGITLPWKLAAEIQTTKTGSVALNIWFRILQIQSGLAYSNVFIG